MKWVVVFNGRRDAYQAPLALAERGALESLVTDWYTPLDRAWCRPLLQLAPERIRGLLASRFRAGLPSARVTADVLGVLGTRIASRGELAAIDRRLGSVAGRIASKRGAGLLAYSYWAHAAFTHASLDTARVIFQVHPHPESLRALYEEELALVPDARESLLAEEEMRRPAHYQRLMAEEPHLADACIAASGFTARTLIEQGIEADRIRVIPYGVDLERFRPGAPPPERPFRVLFVGQFVQRKGLSYLLEAWRRLALPNAELVLAGRGNMDRTLLTRYDGSYVQRERVTDDELRELYRTSHVFCMPSLAEGFGLVYLEALASGTPIIGTPNTGAADVVQEGVEGFLVGIRDVDALAARLRWCYDHPAELAAMRVRARARAERLSWSAFRSELAGALDAFTREAPLARRRARAAAGVTER